MASSPTSRTLAECKALGLTAQVVEKWNAYARIRVDLFDAIDVVACGEGYILGIQACAGGSHSKRLAKAVASPRIAAWIAGGGIFEVWSWSKRGGRGKRKMWTCRKERVTPPREIQMTHSAVCGCGCQASTKGGEREG